MSLTVEEARAVNVLFQWLLGSRGTPPKNPTAMGTYPPTDSQAREAAELLAGHATKTLGGGVSDKLVGAYWPVLMAQLGRKPYDGPVPKRRVRRKES